MQTDIEGSVISDLRFLRPQFDDSNNLSNAANDDCDQPGARLVFSLNPVRSAAYRAFLGAVTLVASDAIAMVSCFLALLMVYQQRASHWQGWDDAVDVANIPASPLQETCFALAPLGCLLLIFLLCGHYTRRLPSWTEARQVIETSVITVFLAVEIVVLNWHAFPKLLIAVPLLLLPAAILGGRGFTKFLLAWTGFWQIPVIIVGDSDGIQAAHSALQRRKLKNFRAVDLLRIDNWLPDQPPENWINLLKRRGAERIILAAPMDCQRDWKVAQCIIDQRIPLSTFSGFSGLPASAIDTFRTLGEDRFLLSYCNNLAHPPARVFKGLFDFLIAGLLVIVLLPVFAAIAVAVRADGGPVFYAQSRIGRRGRSFQCLKFRSMSVKADEILRDYLAANAEAAQEWEIYRKLRHDPRVTRVGRLLRATSLDELPQLWNVLRMDMSLVGPRPILQAEVCRYESKFDYYCETRPGVTGLWQVSGRSTTSYARRVQLDTWYVSNWTIWLDISILVRTVFVVLSRRGAY